MIANDLTEEASFAVDQNDDLTVIVEQLVETVSEQAERISDLEAENHEQAQRIEDLEAENHEQAQRIEDLEAENHEQAQRIEDLEAELEDTEARVDAVGTGLSNANDEIESLQANIEETTPTPQTEETARQEPQTPLEQTVSLPQEMIENESANVRRAVFVARDLTDYCSRVPAGYAMTSAEMTKVLTAGTSAKGHTQTTARVMSLLDDLGGSEVKTVKRRGTKRIVFSRELVQRLDELTGAEENGHSVVMETEV
jgi:hypothetical protein